MSNNGQQKANNNDQSDTSKQTQNQMPENPTLITPPAGLTSGKEPVGSITSPSETDKYRMVLRDYAATVQIEGNLVCLDYTEFDITGKIVQKTILCQVARTQLQNAHHEKAVLRALLREKGRIPGLSGFADHKEVTLLPMDSVLSGTEIHQLPRNVPPTGTDVRFASEEDVKLFSGKHKALFNIGYLYETQVPVGLMLKHFGAGDDGWGDAHMLGVFGATGSGKTVMAASIIAGFAARPEMGMLIIDPQGQFSGENAEGQYIGELGKDSKKWSWRLGEAFRLTGRGKDIKIVRIEDISLESPNLFAHLLDKFDFFDSLGILGSDKKEQTVLEVARLLIEWLRTNQNETATSSLGMLQWGGRPMAEMICRIGSSTYRTPEDQFNKSMDRYDNNPLIQNRVKQIWEKVRAMFDRDYNLEDLLDDVLIRRKIIILDVDTEQELKDLYCSEILHGIKVKAETIYRIKQGKFRKGDKASKYKNAETNALIVIDEAHRFAPQAPRSNREQEKLLSTLRDAIATTRKLGVGWFYITQSIANFNKDIFRQIQTKILGFGIGTGADNEHLETALNNDRDLINRYRSLPRPLTTSVYPFAIIGELVALGNGSRALFISAPGTQQRLFELNPEHFKYKDGAFVLSGRELSSGKKSLPASKPALPPPDDDISF